MIGLADEISSMAVDGNWARSELRVGSSKRVDAELSNSLRSTDNYGSGSVCSEEGVCKTGIALLGLRQKRGSGGKRILTACSTAFSRTQWIRTTREI